MKNNKMLIISITIAIILFFAGLIVGFSMGKKTNNNASNNQQVECIEKDETKKEEENKEEENKEEPEPEEKPKEEEKDSSVKTLKSNGERVTVDISLNGKQNTLIFENNMKTNGTSIFTFGPTNLNFLKGFGTGGTSVATPNEIEYKVIVSKDSKEYLYVAYRNSFDQHILIINDEAKIIGNISSYEESLNCYIMLEKNTGATEEQPFYRADGNYVFYYKFSKSLDKDRVLLDLMKLEIFVDKVTEVNMGTRTSGKTAQCS